MSKDIDDFADELAAIQTDSNLNWAGVRNATPVTRERYYDSVDPSDDDAHDYGLAIEFEAASGETFSEWYEKPPEWDHWKSDLVLLLLFWDIDPGDLDKLRDDEEVYEVPLNDDRSIDWQEIERSVHTKQLEEADDDR